EKVRDETRQMFNTKFGGVELLEGYGATEAAPVVAVNHPDRNRPGSVGQIMPGMEYRLDKVPGIEGGGLLFLRGPNVMAGYISPNNPEGIEPLADGWYDTGDIVDVDDEGYITILGRVKRFAKVGGEMVSLLAVEGMAGAVWPDNHHAAVSVPDSKKGERLILVTDHEGAESAQLSMWARENGAPELAVPKKIIKIAVIPVLGTGKTDYVAIQKLVEDALKVV
ncbi:MAG: AMP-binding protein, partial [Brevundimonas sp.]